MAAFSSYGLKRRETGWAVVVMPSCQTAQLTENDLSGISAEHVKAGAEAPMVGKGILSMA